MAEGRSLLQLQAWLSQSFPTGAFGYSHGLETAVREGLVDDADSLAAWIGDLVEQGSGWTDAVLLNEAHAAAWTHDDDRLRAVADLGLAMSPSAERRRESLQQGQAFVAALRAAWPGQLPPGLPPYVPYCVAVGAAAGATRIAAEDTLVAFLHAFCSTLIAAAVRCAGLGQTVAVQVMARLAPAIVATAARAGASSLDDLGSGAVMSDIMSMRHETLDGRLFIS